VKSTVFKISGSIPAGNYIQLPKTSSQSLGLTGRYMYLLIKPIPTKYFVVHIDVATQDNLVVRISFSNLFKEFKSTSTWLQFPFVCKATRGTVHAVTAAASKGLSLFTFDCTLYNFYVCALFFMLFFLSIVFLKFWTFPFEHIIFLFKLFIISCISPEVSLKTYLTRM